MDRWLLGSKGQTCHCQNPKHSHGKRSIQEQEQGRGENRREVPQVRRHAGRRHWCYVVVLALIIHGGCNAESHVESHQEQPFFESAEGNLGCLGGCYGDFDDGGPKRALRTATYSEQETEGQSESRSTSRGPEKEATSVWGLPRLDQIKMQLKAEMERYSRERKELEDQLKDAKIYLEKLENGEDPAEEEPALTADVTDRALAEMLGLGPDGPSLQMETELEQLKQDKMYAEMKAQHLQDQLAMAMSQSVKIQDLDPALQAILKSHGEKRSPQ